MTSNSAVASHGACEIRGALPAEFESILTREALDFVASIARRFTPKVQELLAARELRQQALDTGEMPDFLPETAHIRDRRLARRRRFRRICSTAASRSPARPIAR